ncbi:Bcl-2-related protein A1 [Holothuria leucospilota]|uniref:Bcl-2-related protein A1 n=1 Tax=Holothuria leucospilota TaxID=206669 RepID=A0A9Q1BDZ2_HOLLE|nr:Bcl-2-related protein A1 [Holothuria leucospilota]
MSLFRHTMGEIGKIARELGRDFVNGKFKSQPSPYTKTLYRVGKEIDEKFQTALNEMVNHVRQCDKETIKATLDAMFEGGLFSWGRIVMAYVFVRKCAQRCREQGKTKDTIEQLAQFVGEYIEDRCTQWIEQRGGWEEEQDLMYMSREEEELMLAALEKVERLERAKKQQAAFREKWAARQQAERSAEGSRATIPPQSNPPQSTDPSPPSEKLEAANASEVVVTSKRKHSETEPGVPTEDEEDPIPTSEGRSDPGKGVSKRETM